MAVSRAQKNWPSTSFIHLNVAAWRPAVSGVSILFRNVRVFDGPIIRENCSILVANGRIVEVGKAGLKEPRAEVIDGIGRTLMPGLIDSHVHVASDVNSALAQKAKLGVTTVLDLFTNPETLRKLKAVE